MPGFFVRCGMFYDELVARLNKISRERATIRSSCLAEVVKERLLAELEAAEKALGDGWRGPSQDAPAGASGRASEPGKGSK